MEWLQANWELILQTVGAVVAGALALVVALTGLVKWRWLGPARKWLARLRDWLTPLTIGNQKPLAPTLEANPYAGDDTKPD